MTTHKFQYTGLNEDQLTKFNQLADLLVDQNRVHNLTTITAAEDIYARHFVDSLAALELLDELKPEQSEPPRLLDIGSGAGFPALPLAIALPDWDITSLEATGKKVRFQEHARNSLNLTNFTARQGRAEILAREDTYRENFDVVTARALAELRVLAELTIPFVRVGGHFLAWKGPDPAEEVDSARQAIQLLGGRVRKFYDYQLAQNRKFTIVVIKKVTMTPAEYPREFKNIKKSPLGE
ncbi:Ribosomal RNA small subunit methyltransferase G [Anaerohalosphaera lusitana]|uniref:Ribosomal RNA small subunit methyltransferase G n=1 Tax=Anaerohalosphaera lusitana TaxID=1936003 RepID=A0A1U9NQY9_9BACT|nr:16S rRNA (guanine(527)-N(7))-methyltransferase RsmG [Anaerohalosphaera lusitana]AQT70207.1 Ribosomal RNA small subunit methyltransferase G [Anaerohalosphaera lusitana]